MSSERERALEGRYHELNEQLRTLQIEASQIRRELLALRSPFKLGDIVEWRLGRNTRKRGVVNGVKGVGTVPDTWSVTVIRKDGTLGATRQVYGYDHPVLIERAKKDAQATEE